MYMCICVYIQLYVMYTMLCIMCYDMTVQPPNPATLLGGAVLPNVISTMCYDLCQ